MEKQNFIYVGMGALDIIDPIADAIDALPYEAMYSQFEGNEEIFFTFLINAYNEDYASIVTSAMSFKIEDGMIEVDIISTSPTTDMGMENLALKQQMTFWDNFFKGFGFKDNDNHHEHHHHEHHHDCNCGHDHDCDCDDDCTCGDECSCGHNHVH